MNKHISALAKWNKPDPRQVNLNVYGSYYTVNNAGSVGAVLPDLNGSFIGVYV
jgi:hypothetical protein